MRKIVVDSLSLTKRTTIKDVSRILFVVSTTMPSSIDRLPCFPRFRPVYSQTGMFLAPLSILIAASLSDLIANSCKQLIILLRLVPQKWN